MYKAIKAWEMYMQIDKFGVTDHVKLKICSHLTTHTS